MPICEGLHLDLGLRRRRELTLGTLGGREEAPLRTLGQLRVLVRFQKGLCEILDDVRIKVLTAETRVAAGGVDLKDAT